MVLSILSSICRTSPSRMFLSFWTWLLISSCVPTIPSTRSITSTRASVLLFLSNSVNSSNLRSRSWLVLFILSSICRTSPSRMFLSFWTWVLISSCVPTVPSTRSTRSGMWCVNSAISTIDFWVAARWEVWVVEFSSKRPIELIMEPVASKRTSFWLRWFITTECISDSTALWDLLIDSKDSDIEACVFFTDSITEPIVE